MQGVLGCATIKATRLQNMASQQQEMLAIVAAAAAAAAACTRV